MLAFAITCMVIAVGGFLLLRAPVPAPADGAARRTGWPTWLIVATIVAGLVLLIAGLFWFALVGIFVCGSGDGGAPYTAPASTLGSYCDAGGPFVAFALPVAPLVIGGARTAQTGQWPYFAAGLLVGALLANSPIVATSTLPDTCSAKTRQESRAQNRPERCEHY